MMEAQLPTALELLQDILKIFVKFLQNSLIPKQCDENNAYSQNGRVSLTKSAVDTLLLFSIFYSTTAQR